MNRSSLARLSTSLAASLFLTLPSSIVALAQSRAPEPATPQAGFVEQADVAYGSDKRQTYDLYVPDNVQADAPLLVFFYGGGWSSGNKELYRPLGRHYAAKGMIVAIPNYRVYPQVKFPDFVEDGAKAVVTVQKTVAARYGDKHPLFVAGHSAGAHIALLLTLDTHYLKARSFDAKTITGTIGLSGPYDFLPLTDEKYKRVFPEATRAASQPINFARGDAPPVLLLTGLADDTVRPENATKLAAAIMAKGGKAQVRTYEGAGHIGTVLGLDENWPVPSPPTGQDMQAFIAERSAALQTK